MATSLIVTVNDRAVVERLADLRRRGGDVRPALERVADDFLDTERAVFATRGGSEGTPWAGGATLDRSGRLMRSLTTRGARGSRRQISQTRLVMGTGHPLAHLHQHGTQDRWVRTRNGVPLSKPRYAGRLPARPVVLVGEADRARWQGFISDYVMARPGGVGL